MNPQSQSRKNPRKLKQLPENPSCKINTPRKFNIAPKNRQSQKGPHLPTIIFQGRAVKFRGCKTNSSTSWEFFVAQYPIWRRRRHVEATILVYPWTLTTHGKMKVFHPNVWVVLPRMWVPMIYIYILFLQNDIHLHIVHLSESKTHHTKNINHLHEAHFANTFWDVRWDDVTMLFFPKPLLHSVENLSNVPSPYSTPTITRTDPWNCSLETVYSCMGSLEIYQFSSRRSWRMNVCSSWYRIAFWLGEWYQSIPIPIKFPKTLRCRCLYPKRRLPKTNPLKVWRKQGHPGKSALQQKPATMRFDYKITILVPATQKKHKMYIL